MHAMCMHFCIPSSLSVRYERTQVFAKEFHVIGKGETKKKVLCRGSCRVRFFPATQNPFVSKKQTLFCVFLFHNFVSAMPYVRINLPTLKQVVHFK